MTHLMNIKSRPAVDLEKNKYMYSPDVPSPFLPTINFLNRFKTIARI